MATGSSWTAILRGFCRRCPNCGAGALYHRYLKPVAQCSACGESYADIRADDFPPYLTILVVGHIIVPLVLIAERYGWSTELQAAVWLPVTLALTLLLLPRFKGAIIGLMWSLGMGAEQPRS
jgi:uncharacterized protein (DUF983 family)